MPKYVCTRRYTANEERYHEDEPEIRLPNGLLSTTGALASEDAGAGNLVVGDGRVVDVDLDTGVVALLIMTMLVTVTQEVVVLKKVEKSKWEVYWDNVHCKHPGS